RAAQMVSRAARFLLAEFQSLSPQRFGAGVYSPAAVVKRFCEKRRRRFGSMKRREFIGTSAAAFLASELSWALPADHKLKAVGVQLYSVRNAMKSDFDGTVAKVAQIGYKEVEFA